jgi:hypothetical protein
VGLVKSLGVAVERPVLGWVVAGLGLAIWMVWPELFGLESVGRSVWMAF